MVTSSLRTYLPLSLFKICGFEVLAIDDPPYASWRFYVPRSHILQKVLFRS